MTKPSRVSGWKRCLSLATEYQRVDESIRKHAQEFEKQGIAAIDALHIATAKSANVDFFIACDDRLLKKGRQFKMKSMNPVDFVQKELGEQT